MPAPTNDFPFIRDYCTTRGESHQMLHAQLRKARRMDAPDDAWSYDQTWGRWRTVSSLPEHAPYRHDLARRGLLPEGS